MNIAARFWSKVAIGSPDSCWLWKASRKTNGYGQFRIGGAAGSMVGAHRVAFDLSNPNNPLQEKEQACHHCDVRACCNPAHLFRGSAADNHADRSAKYVICRKGHPMSGHNIVHTREGWRACRACRNDWFRTRRASRAKRFGAAA